MAVGSVVVLVLLGGLTVGVLALLAVTLLGRSEGHLFDAEQVRRTRAAARRVGRAEDVR